MKIAHEFGWKDSEIGSMPNKKLGMYIRYLNEFMTPQSPVTNNNKTVEEIAREERLKDMDKVAAKWRDKRQS